MQNAPTTKVPHGKKVLEFLQELDGENQRLKNAWIFLDESVANMLFHQLEVDNYELGGCYGHYCFVLPHETDDRSVASIKFMRNGDTGWYFVTHISCDEEDCPYHISFIQASSHPTEFICLAIEE